jgi:hypothetical protein
MEWITLITTGFAFSVALFLLPKTYLQSCLNGKQFYCVFQDDSLFFQCREIKETGELFDTYEEYPVFSHQRSDQHRARSNRSSHNFVAYQETLDTYLKVQRYPLSFD